MSIYEDLNIFWLGCKAHFFSEDLIQQVTASMATSSCGDDAFQECRNDAAALRLKLGAIAVVLVASVLGVAIPFVGRQRFLRTDGGLFVFAKAFAAGVILATGFVHMLHDAESALTDPCLPDTPWRDFPFSGFVAMVAALATLVVDFVGTQYYERRNSAKGEADEEGRVEIVPLGPERDGAEWETRNNSMHIVGMHAHAAAHRHSHAHGPEACDGIAGHGHAHGEIDEEDGISSHARHVVAAQILELGIVSHSVIIGLSLGVSQSPCTIRPLIAALSFHQFFEGFALGGCISQAQFNNVTSALMAFFFSITTPAGIGVGAGIASLYNANSPRALVVEGMLDSLSAGILIYMALVDLIATDFLSRKMRCNVRLMVASYISLFLGAGLMASLAIWA